ncbi:MAG: 1-deoxy-D-xylulose-5-phosphate synthase [Eubacteriales bacterium]|nr:1-deoxy-D-xylulose-5-phosphate synthase [Eubacteriales bacterium]
MSILQHINSPADVKKLSPAQLPQLARELREYIKDTVEKNGGHLSSNLGTVELTLALHRVFESPRDKIVWDVGHQAYTHMIITGRREAFPTLRTYQGLSGFPKPAENPHDTFLVGHSSTSISAALGMARVRDLKGETDNIVAVIGDGALTGGLSLEALNDVGRSNTRLIIVLNDNEMSIQRNVGALAEYLFQIRARKSYQNAKRRIKLVLRRDSLLRKIAESTKNSFKYLLLHGTWFEEIGIKYVGPFDGHNIEHLTQALETAKKFDTPVLIHVRTQKGKGDAQAEADPEKYHGVNPKGTAGNGFTYTGILGTALAEMATRDERLVAIAAAMPQTCGLMPFYDRHPQRFFDVGIAEEHAVTMAAGMAQRGYRPVVAIYSTFLQRAYDEILHDVCIAHLPVVFFVCNSGLTGQDGETHQGTFSLSYLTHMPGMRIVSPSDAGEIHRLLEDALSADGPVAILLPKGAAPQPPAEPNAGTGWYCHTRGGKVALLSYGGCMLGQCYSAREALAAQDVSADVWHCPIIMPVDTNQLNRLLADYDLVISVEDNVIIGGFGMLLKRYCPPELAHKLRCYGIEDCFVPHGKVSQLLKQQNLTGAQIAARILNEDLS